MTFQPISHLRHVDLAVPDFNKQFEFYTNTWGLKEVSNDGGISFLAAEGSPEQYVIRLRKDETKRLDLIAFGAHTKGDVDQLAENLLAAGIKLIGSEDLSNIFLFASTACFAAHITFIGIAKCSSREQSEREKQLVTLADEVGFKVVSLETRVTDDGE